MLMEPKSIQDAALYFSYDIPDLICDDDDWINQIQFSLSVASKPVFATTLDFPPGSRTLIFPCRDVISAHMRNNALPFAVCRIDMQLIGDAGADARHIEFEVLYSLRHFYSGAEDVAESFFLTDSDVMFVPRDYNFKLWAFNNLSDPMPIKVYLTMQDGRTELAIDGEQEEPQFYSYPRGAHAIQIDYDLIMSRANDNQVLRTGDVPVAVRCVAGQRTIDFYILQEIPSAILYYTNSFNVPQSVFFFGSWTRKIDTKTQSAMVNDENRAYDFEDSTEIEIKSHQLDAVLISDMRFIAKSPQVSALLIAGRKIDAVNGIVSQLSIKDSPHDSELDTVALTLKVNEHLDTSALEECGYRAFTNHFNKIFS